MHRQRCRSVFNIGGYNSAFLPFFRDFEILGGGYSGFVDFSSFNDFENLGAYSGFTVLPPSRRPCVFYKIYCKSHYSVNKL